MLCLLHLSFYVERMDLCVAVELIGLCVQTLAGAGRDGRTGRSNRPEREECDRVVWHVSKLCSTAGSWIAPH
jgi:hypothetical protein